MSMILPCGCFSTLQHGLYLGCILESWDLSTRSQREWKDMKMSALLRSVRPLFIVAVGAVFVVAGVGVALADNSNSSSPVPGTSFNSSNSGIAGKSWSDLGAEQFVGLPTGTRIVDCSPTQKQLSPGVVASGAPGFFVQHPGFHFLIDGRCAFDPSAISTPMRIDWVEGTPPPVTSSNTSSPDPRTAYWSPIVAVKFASLPAGTRIVNCWEGIKQLPQGVRLEVGQGFSQEHLGFHFLIDGRCALDSSVIPTPLHTDVVVRREPGTHTRAFDLQWFGTGADGGPPVGVASCFVGDPLNNHCGVPTNIRSQVGPNSLHQVMRETLRP